MRLLEDFLDTINTEEVVDRQFDDDFTAEPKQKKHDGEYGVYSLDFSAEIKFQVSLNRTAAINEWGENGILQKQLRALHRLLEKSDAVESYAFDFISFSSLKKSQFDENKPKWMDTPFLPRGEVRYGELMNMGIYISFVDDPRKVWRFIQGLCSISSASRKYSDEKIKSYRFIEIQNTEGNGKPATLRADDIDGISYGVKMVSRDIIFQIFKNSELKSSYEKNSNVLNSALFNSLQRINGKLALGLTVQYLEGVGNVNGEIMLYGSDAIQLMFKMKLIAKIFDMCCFYSEIKKDTRTWYRTSGWSVYVQNEWGSALFALRSGMKRMDVDYEKAEEAINKQVEKDYERVNKIIKDEISKSDCNGDMKA